MTQPPDHAHDVHLNECRTAFEKYYSDNNPDCRSIKKTVGGEYKFMQAHSAWINWKAAWSARTPAITGSAGQVVDPGLLSLDWQRDIDTIKLALKPDDDVCAVERLDRLGLLISGLLTGPGLTADAVEQVREALKTGWHLSTWTACINWRGGRNEKEWLDDLRVLIEQFQDQCKPAIALLPPSEQQQSTGKGVEG